MDYDDMFDMPDGDFIPGIYNYCDAWCARCLYTDKCKTFAMEKIFTKEYERKERIEKSIAENKKFWEQINNSVKEAAELIDEVIPLVKNKFHGFDEWDDPQDIDDAIKKDEKKRVKAENHKLTKTAVRYEKAVDKWFEERKDILKFEYLENSRTLKISYPEIDDENELKQLAEAVEVVRYYIFQIHVKLTRAFTSMAVEQEEPEIYENFPKDSEGSAMVALKGINNSIGSWNYLMTKLEKEKESIMPILRMLIWIKTELEKTFPGALTFEWPPTKEK